MVNDLGGNPDGTGADASAAQQVVDEIAAAGGEAVANHDDVAEFEGAANLVAQAVGRYGQLDVLVTNAGILRDKGGRGGERRGDQHGLGLGHVPAQRRAGQLWGRQGGDRCSRSRAGRSTS